MTPADIALIRADVDEAFKGLALAARTVDIESYLDYFDNEHFTALNADGTVTHSMANFEAVARQSFAAIKSYSSLDFSKVKITVVNRTTAVLVNEYQAELVLTSGESLSAAGAGSQVWSKSADRWQLVSVSSSGRSVQ